MTWFADLSPCAFVPRANDRFKSVAWLAFGHSYEVGQVSDEFFVKLLQLLHEPWHPPWACSGHHICDLCQFASRHLRAYVSGDLTSSHELFVPGGGAIYVSPVNIAHYIDAHRYHPPEEFVEAVLACPPMRSNEYLKLLLQNGMREVIVDAREQTEEVCHDLP